MMRRMSEPTPSIDPEAQNTGCGDYMDYFLAREKWRQGEEVDQIPGWRHCIHRSAVYKSLREDAYGHALRLEQEQINWDWALEQL